MSQPRTSELQDPSPGASWEAGGRKGGASTGALGLEQLGSEELSQSGVTLEEVTAELKPAQIWSQSLPAGEPGGRNKPDMMEGEERQAR